MEQATTKPSKSSSNISELVSRFSKVCRLRSIGVLPSEVPDHHNLNNAIFSLGEDGSDATEETKCEAKKAYPNPVEVQSKSSVCGDSEIEKLFDIASGLKLAYVQLQEAHVPYNTEKIVAADELVVTKLEALCKIKRAYKERVMAKAKSGVSRLCAISAKLEAAEKLLGKLKADMKAKDSEIRWLQQELFNLNLVNVDLMENIKKESLESRKVKLNDISLIHETFKAASKSIHDFAKPLISLMKAAGWDLDLAAESIEPAVVYTKRSHKKYAFEAYISRRMFRGISDESCGVDEIVKFEDPMDALMAFPDSNFAKFCVKKYLTVVHQDMEASFFGNLEQRMFVMSGKHPRTTFYQAFAKMAKWVWILQGMAASAADGAEMYSVSKGCLFSDAYMESVEEDSKGSGKIDEKGTCKVAFMIMPGFKVEDSVVRSRVYLSRT